MYPYCFRQIGATPAVAAAHFGHAEALVVLRDGGADFNILATVTCSIALYILDRSSPIESLMRQAMF